MIRTPVIVVGMHRSGTSLLVRQLQQLGLFIGTRRDANDESRYFQGLNEWILQQSGGAWDHPTPMQYLLADTLTRRSVTAHISADLHSPRVIGYVGVGGYLRWRSTGHFPACWGWKDPRSTFTLPIWLDLFPAARVIHVFRHGVDVASSLLSRNLQRRHQLLARHERRTLAYQVLRKRSFFTESARCSSLEGAFSLWEEYVDEGRANVATAAHSLELRYEDLLLHPKERLMELADFCGLSSSTQSIGLAARAVDPNRAYAHRALPELAAFAAGVGHRLASRGY